MGLIFQNGITIDSVTRKVVGVGDLTNTQVDNSPKDFSGQNIQDIANQGYQVSGTDVFSNGVKIGSTGSAPPTVTLPSPVSAPAPTGSGNYVLYRDKTGGLSVGNTSLGGSFFDDKEIAGRFGSKKEAKKALPGLLSKSTTPVTDQTLGLQAALDRISAGTPGANDQANVDYAKSKGLLATLTSPDGKKVVVATGSQKASDLISKGYTLGDKLGGGTMTADELAGSQIGANVNAVPGDDIVGDSAATIEKEKAIANIEAQLKLIEDTRTDMQKKNDDLSQTMLDAIGELSGNQNLNPNKMLY